ncbi:MAG: radical SAM protein [Spirochaetales bacterium]|nr:radical SAM protein [Spirochaetales bacterium]
MHYEGNVIRPPSEWNSIILQVTVGCSHNKCTFCGAYKDVNFRIKDDETVLNDIAFAAAQCRRQKRGFLADGDVLILSQKRLIRILKAIREQLPWVTRVTLYANAKAMLSKTTEQLQELKRLGLSRVYMGLESGNSQVLRNIRKGADPEKMIRAAQHVKNAGLFLSVTVLLGIGGTTLSSEHAKDTGLVLSQMKPNQIAALTLMVMENTPLFHGLQNGAFSLPDTATLLSELYTLVEHINVDRAQLQANHASNYLEINCRLPRDKEKILQEIKDAQQGGIQLRPEHMRRL